MFCLITVIVSLAVHDAAFHAPSLTNVKRVFQTKNLGPVKCTPLRWKKEWLKKPVFRRFDGSIISDEPLQYHKLKDDMRRQSLDYGCEKPIEPKAWRRGAAWYDGPTPREQPILTVFVGKAPDATRSQVGYVQQRIHQ
jgi:uncharacterized protein DUF3435